MTKVWRFKGQLQIPESEPEERKSVSPTFGLDGRFNVQSVPVGIKVGVGFDRPVRICGCGVLRLKKKHTQIIHI